MHAAFDTDPLLTKDFGIIWHEVMAWAKAVAIVAAAEVVVKATIFVFQAAHLFVAEGRD